MKKIILLNWLIYSLVSLCSGQILPKLAYLDSAASQKHAEQLKALKMEHLEAKKLDWLSYLPGLGYDFMNQKPIITYNANQIAVLLRSRHLKRQKLAQLGKQQNISLEADLIRLESTYNRANALFAAFASAVDVYRDELLLFEIAKKQYENNELPLEQFLPKQIEIKKVKAALDAQKANLMLIVLELETIAKTKVTYSLPDY